uniref:Uncharacterized protein n=1 Tax=Amphimedon queenslandica TaxID=400682 RepID=A0A1X7SNP5_AMPQE
MRLLPPAFFPMWSICKCIYCGGFQFLECSPNSRNLEVSALTTLLSSKSLKNREVLPLPFLIPSMAGPMPGSSRPSQYYDKQ